MTKPMTKTVRCCEVVSQLHELVREELSPAAARGAELHLAACAGCTAAFDEVRQGYRLLQAVRRHELPRGAEARFPVMRAHIMATIRAEQAPRLSWLQLAFGSAAAALVFTAITLVSGSGGDLGPARVSAPADSLPVVAKLAEPAPIATVAFAKTADGVALSWPGDEPTYKILRSTKPGRFQEAAVTIVCGNSWTDREDSGALVYYQVVPAHDRCRT